MSENLRGGFFLTYTVHDFFSCLTVTVAGGSSYLYSRPPNCWHQWRFILSSDHSSEAGWTT